MFFLLLIDKEKKNLTTETTTKITANCKVLCTHRYCIVVFYTNVFVFRVGIKTLRPIYAYRFVDLIRTPFAWANRLFYSCVLSNLALEWKRGWSGLCIGRNVSAFHS